MRALYLTLACLIAAPVWASELIGTTVPPYPNHLTSDMGSCIPYGDEFCAYSIASLNKQDGSVAAVAAKQFINDVDGEPIWKIIDVLDAPTHADGQMWAFEECHVDGTLDPSLIGLVTFKDIGGWIETGETVWAARFDVEAKKLVMPELSKVQCVLPGS